MADLITARVAVDEMFLAGARFCEIESAIDDAPLPEQDRAALWLYAWARDDRGVQWHNAADTVALVAD